MPRKSKKSNSSKTKVSKTSNINSLDKMKMEIARDFGVKLGANASAKENGQVGGEMVKRLVEKAKGNNYKSKSSK